MNFQLRIFLKSLIIIKNLGNLFDSYGSDKKTRIRFNLQFNYWGLEEIDLVIEIGIGSNNEDILSNMSSKGKPGSSLRSFRDFYPIVR